MLKKIVLLMVGILILSRLFDLGYAEEDSISNKGPRQILFEARVIELNDRNFFKSCGVNISYDSTTGKSVIKRDDFEKILSEIKRDKDNSAVSLLSYVTTTAINGQLTIVNDTAPITICSIKDGKLVYEKKDIGTSFRSLGTVGRDSYFHIVSTDLEVSYSRIVGWAEVSGSSEKIPIISEIKTATSLMLESGDTIVLGGSTRKADKTNDEGQILFLVTIKLQGVECEYP